MPLPEAVNRSRGTLKIAIGSLSIEADETGYELLKSPRGRIMRLVPSSGDEYSKHVASASPLTNLQRAVQTSKRIGWLKEDIALEELPVVVCPI
jgi:hypothetical protein